MCCISSSFKYSQILISLYSYLISLYSMHLGLRMCLRDDVGGFVLAKTAWFSPLYDVRRGRSRRVAYNS
ncbi:hypothetical protein MtrunA17_Chr7g0250761 [Medicago truncatula]|uniref:Transmembrane protein n=1 Tax=Medicago truncatula TaxID=3880 RepID=A0A396H8D9_MEDTR|nr:hypothetical protein MtrunA17_Chr7g0250761 [Medicago truncatula]